MFNSLEDGDIEEGINAASKIGDDYLQKKAQGYMVPDSFNHGTSAQRMRWLKKGIATGDVQQGDTFSQSYDSLWFNQRNNITNYGGVSHYLRRLRIYKV